MDKDFEDLASTLAWANENNPFERTTPTPDGKFAVFPKVKRHPPNSPEQRAAEDAWESRCEQMHDNQVPITVEPKPEENTIAAHKDRLVRGD